MASIPLDVVLLAQCIHQQKWKGGGVGERNRQPHGTKSAAVFRPPEKQSPGRPGNESRKHYGEAPGHHQLPRIFECRWAQCGSRRRYHQRGQEKEGAHPADGAHCFLGQESCNVRFDQNGAVEGRNKRQKRGRGGHKLGLSPMFRGRELTISGPNLFQQVRCI